MDMPMGGWVDMAAIDVGVMGPMEVGVEGAVREGELGGPIVDGEGTPEGDIIPPVARRASHRKRGVSEPGVSLITSTTSNETHES
jgi:hypothetical protein